MNSEQMRDAINKYNSECLIDLPKFTLEDIATNYVAVKYPDADADQKASWIAYYSNGGGKESIETDMDQLKSSLTKAMTAYYNMVACFSPNISSADIQYAALGDKQEMSSKIQETEGDFVVVLNSSNRLCYKLPGVVDTAMNKLSILKNVVNGDKVRWCSVAGNGIELFLDSEKNLLHRERPLKSDEHLLLLAYKYNHKGTRGKGKGKYKHHLSRWRKMETIKMSCLKFDKFIKQGNNTEININNLGWTHYSHATARLKKYVGNFKYMIYALAICRYNGSKETGHWKKQDSFEILAISKFKSYGMKSKKIGIKIMSE